MVRACKNKGTSRLPRKMLYGVAGGVKKRSSLRLRRIDDLEADLHLG